MEIVWLGEPAAHDAARVGGKAAHLSRLAAQERVPPGFVLPATTLALAYSGVGTSPDSVLGEAVTAAYDLLAIRTGTPLPRVAVRSSALDEDGPDASFAGQHSSFLNVSGVDDVMVAIGRCWDSARSAEALAYRRQQGLGAVDVQLAVLVQQMAPADVSAVVFSANPVSGRHDEIVLTASWGLGESIVGGTVTPDTFHIHKQGLVVHNRVIADKHRMTIASTAGTIEVDVPRFMRSQPSLTDDQVIEMAALAQRLEATMGWPVDVECAYGAGQLSLLQCRPITTLAARPS